MKIKCSRIKVWLIICCSILGLFATGCEPYRALIFENQTSRPVQAHLTVVLSDYSGVPKVTWDDNYKNAIDAGQSKKLVTHVSDQRAPRHKYAIVAVNDNNEIVFSNIFTWDELHDMDWRVIIK